MTSCFNYGQACTYLNVCNAWPNPLAKLESGPPLSMKIEYWNPAAQPVREVLDLAGGIS